MNPTTHAIRVGLRRGWTEFTLSLRAPQDIGFYVVTSLGALIYLYFRRNDAVEGTDLLFPALMLPSILGGFIAFGGFIGPAFSLSLEREDGTLLRSKALPNGMVGYVSGQAVFQALGALPGLLLMIVPSLVLFDVLQRGAIGIPIMVGMLVLGLLATLPIGIVLGSLVKSPRSVSGLGMLPMMALVGTSGIFYPFALLPEWVQVIAQAFPVYWLGLGMRSAFLPDAAAALEIGGSWRTLETIGVLGAWAIVGLLVVPVVLRRMARRESGSTLENRRHEAMQRAT